MMKTKTSFNLENSIYKDCLLVPRVDEEYFVV
jgi:hypothetical protein